MELTSRIADWARYSVPDDFWPVAVILIILCACGFFGGFYYFFRLRVLENIPTSKVRSAAQGYLELTGRGELIEGPEIIAPLTGKTCTWYSYIIQERRRSRRKNHWVTIEKGTSEELFTLIDDTGKCIIDPEGASVVPAETNIWYGPTPRPSSRVPAGNSLIGTGQYRYIEKRMHPGNDLYAIGLFQTVGGANAQFDVNSDLVSLLKEWKSDSEQLLRKFDKNKDGEVDIHEWEAVRKAALEEVMKQHEELKSTPPVNMLGRTHDRRRPFILSAVSQDNLITRYRIFWRSLIVTFFMTGIIATWLINLRMSAG